MEGKQEPKQQMQIQEEQKKEDILVNNELLDISQINMKKQESMIFDILVSMGNNNKEKHFANNFTGLAAVPIVGQYARGNYEFNDVKGIFAFECLCDSEKNIIRNSETQEIIQLPDNVKDLIFKIPYPIKHNFKENDNNNKNNNQNQKYQNQDQDQEKRPKMEFHPMKFHNAININFVVSISFQNSFIKNKVPFNQKQKQQQQQDDQWLQMNLVCHPYIFQEIQFSGKSKRMIQNQPVCIVQLENDQSVKEFTFNQSNVKFNELRSEYMSCHMGKGMSLCFSPNNMKFYVDQDKYYQMFYSILLDEQNFHHVFFHINFMNRELEGALKQIENMMQLINYLEAMQNEQNQLGKLILHLKSIFVQQK